MTFTYFYCKTLLFDLKSYQDIGVKRAGPLEVVARKKSNLYDPGSAKPIPHALGQVDLKHETIVLEKVILVVDMHEINLVYSNLVAYGHDAERDNDCFGEVFM